MFHSWCLRTSRRRTYCEELMFEVNKCHIIYPDVNIETAISDYDYAFGTRLWVITRHCDDLQVPGVVEVDSTGLPHLFQPSKTSKFISVLHTTPLNKTCFSLFGNDFRRFREFLDTQSSFLILLISNSAHF